MPQGDNKCKNCGQFAGRGHRCQQPPTGPTHGGDAPAIPNSSTSHVPDVDERVARAQAVAAARHEALSGPSDPGLWVHASDTPVNYPNPDSLPNSNDNGHINAGLIEVPGTGLMSDTNITIVRQMMDGEPVSEADAVAAAVEFRTAMLDFANDNAYRMHNGDPEYTEDEQSELNSRLTAIKTLTGYMSDNALMAAARRINGWTPETAERMLNSSTVPRENLLFSHADEPFEAERHYFDRPNL